LAKYLGFSTIGISLKSKFEKKEEIVESCRKNGVQCFFRTNCDDLKGTSDDYPKTIRIAEDVVQAKSYKFDILESGKSIDEVLEARKFCMSRQNINFVLEIDFHPLRQHQKAFFTGYITSLLKLVKICKRRKIPVVFSSAAQNPVDLVTPRSLHFFYSMLGGTSDQKTVLSKKPSDILNTRFNLNLRL
jgi:hypothetical protein